MPAIVALKKGQKNRILIAMLFRELPLEHVAVNSKPWKTKDAAEAS
jgi:hypothetical protein